MAAKSHLRDTAKALFSEAIKAADPALALRNYVEKSGLPTPKAGGQTYVIALGKAAPSMLSEALKHISGPHTALAVTHHDNAQNVDGATVLTAAHPVPDAAGQAAAKRVLDLLSQAGANDRVIALISGGGSALLPAPTPPLTLADKQAVNQLLLESGLDIVEVNMIRQQLSELKGGGFLRHAAPAPVTALILSDVVGDDLRAIASGPTVSPIGTRKAASTLLAKLGLFERLPSAVQSLLSTPQESVTLPRADNHLIGGNSQSLEAAYRAADGWAATILTPPLTGDVEDAAQRVVATAKACDVSEPTLLIFGGETTVTLRGDGRGGRNQELALRVARLATDTLACNWVFLSGGTDGRDGPTDASGGLVDGTTLARIKASGHNTDALLANNDSYAALQAAGDLLMTGATGTNVADVQLMLLTA